ncbi:hypothetical protein [Brevibacillus formosus]|uniref:hypothetical protein n=1 Tax=Brevibacillus formosus TaxID=54913 RepID=UPI003F19C6B8
MDNKEFFPTVYVGERKSGKTTRILEEASKTGLPILASNIMMKRYLEGTAKQLGFTSVTVITLDDLKDRRVNKVYIDEAQLMLEHLLKVSIASMSVTTYDLVDLGNEKEPWTREGLEPPTP